MRKQRPYDFDKLFPGAQPLKQTTVVRPPRSKETVGRVNHLGETRNPNLPSKVSKEVRVATRSSRNTSGYTDSSRGSSAQKTSRKPSVANIQLVASRHQHQPDVSLSRTLPIEQVQQFFSGLGVRTVVKYVPVALHHERKSVKRNLTNQILAVRLSTTTYPSQEQTICASHHRVESQPTGHAKPQTGITLTTSAVRSPLLQSTSRVLAHKNSCQSIASSVSSRYSSVHSNANQPQQSNTLRSVNERFRQSEQKIKKLKEKLSQLYHLKSEASQKNLRIAGTKLDRPRMVRYESILLR